MHVIEIRVAVPDDAERLAQVTQEVWLTTYPNEERGITREDILARGFLDPIRISIRRVRMMQHLHAQRTWVAVCNDEIIGFCRATRAGENYIQALYILQAFQRQGIGTRFFEVATAWLDEPPYDSRPVYLTVAVYNHNAINFYTRLGFRPSGRPVCSEIARLPTDKIIPEIEMVRYPKNS